MDKAQKDLLNELQKENIKMSTQAIDDLQKRLENLENHYLPKGVHDVEIEKVELMKSTNGTYGMKFFVKNQEGNGSAVYWLSENALLYTIENCTRLLVHNVEDEKKKAGIRDYFSIITTASEVFEAMYKSIERAKKEKKPLKGVLVIEEDESRTYTNNKGEEKPGLNSSLLWYKPEVDKKPKAKMSVKSIADIFNDDGVEEIDTSDVPF